GTGLRRRRSDTKRARAPEGQSGSSWADSRGRPTTAMGSARLSAAVTTAIRRTEPTCSQRRSVERGRAGLSCTGPLGTPSVVVRREDLTRIDKHQYDARRYEQAPGRLDRLLPAARGERARR